MWQVYNLNIQVTLAWKQNQGHHKRKWWQKKSPDSRTPFPTHRSDPALPYLSLSCKYFGWESRWVSIGFLLLQLSLLYDICCLGPWLGCYNRGFKFYPLHVVELIHKENAGTEEPHPPLLDTLHKFLLTQKTKLLLSQHTENFLELNILA